jgi:hypothetical protein
MDAGRWVDARATAMRRAASIVMVVAVVGGSLLVAGGIAAAAEPEPIPLTPLTDISSLDATVTLTAAGTIEGEAAQGDLTAELTTNDQDESRIEVTGSLLGEVVSRVGGLGVKLFRPSRLTVYRVPEGTYIVLGGLIDMCVKQDDPAATAALDQLSPRGLMSTLTGSDVARGTLVGDEDRNGVPVRHYLVDGASFLTAAQQSSDPTVGAFAAGLRTAADADLYLGADSGYPIAYGGRFDGYFAPIAFDGDVQVQIDVTGINTGTDVELPSSCDYAIPR